jgi:hypothetical protein
MKWNMMTLHLVVMLMVVGGSLVRADEPVAAPPTKSAAEVVREETKPVVAARALLRRLAESKDREVYDEFMAEAYRKAYSFDDFAVQAAAVRKLQRLADAIPSVEGWVLLKPKDGEPRAASLTAGSREAVIQASPKASDPLLAAAVQSPTTENVLCLRLVESDGRWRVTEFRQLSWGKELYDYHEPIQKMPKVVEGGKRRVISHLNGKIVKLDEDSFVLKPGEKEDKWFAEPDRTERTIKVDEKTIVWKTNMKSDGGHEFETGTRADLKVGSEVSVNAADDAHHTDAIEVIRREPNGGPGL